MIEPLNQGEYNIINSVAEADQLARDAALPSVAVLSDLYHVAADREFLTGYFRALKETGYDARVSVEAQCDDIPGQAAAILEVLHKAWDAA